MNAGTADSRRLVVLLDDAANGIRLLELSCALARTLQRELELVFVEDTRSLSAATLPLARVLPYAGTDWIPLSPQVLEQGYRAHAARLRAIAHRIATQHSVNWSLRIMRSDLARAATDLRGESDLLLLSGTRSLATPPGPARVRRTMIAVTRGPSAADARAMDVARQWAQAMAGMLETLQEDAPTILAGTRSLALRGTRPDVLVMSRAGLSVALPQPWTCPVLLVD